MSSIVVAPLGGAQGLTDREPEQCGPPNGPAGAVDRTRGPRAVRPWSLDVVARAGRRVRVGVNDAGMATAEYAIATLAAVGFAGLLLVVLKSDAVRALLTGLVKQALKA